MNVFVMASSVIKLSVVMLSNSTMSAIMIEDIEMSVIMLSVRMMSANMMNDIVMSATLLSVVY
jgi:hypothetical protein